MDHEFTSIIGAVPLGESDRRLLEMAKEAFFSSWSRGRRPRLEEFLGSLPETCRLAALPELLLIELRSRRALREFIAAQEYLARFPDQAEFIARFFEQPSLTDPMTAGEGTVPGPKHDTLASSPEGRTNRSESDTARAERDPGAIPERFGRYRILRELGRGGMGAVYLALDVHLDRNVALKIPFFQGEDGEAVERFYREARAMATVQHANLCPIFDVGRFERWHFLSMAYIDGHTLSRRLKETGALPVSQAAALLKTVAGALHKVHSSGIVHRDLKPANIMLTAEDVPVVMDFGLARRRKAGEAELTQSGDVFGSPAYMAPEQVEARHDEIGPATDVYALGVILYQMVTGRRPFEGSQMSIFGQIVSRMPEPPSRLRPDLPREIDWLCLKALSKAPSQRQASAAAFADELDRLLRSRSGDSRTVSLRPGPAEGPEPAVEPEPSSVSRSRRDAELRQVTVAVFTYDDDEASGVSSASHSEWLHAKSQTFESFVRERVERLGGVTISSSGQDVIACFGFPQAFEDAPQRAVRAALQVLRELPAQSLPSSNLPAAARAAVILHSGEAVAEELAGPQGTGISLVGEARNVAVRLNTVAEPGAILVSAATHHRVALYFECEPLGVRRVRGLSQPVELFQVVKEAASWNRVELADPGNLTPLVGRDTELSILKDRWEQALDGLGQIVLLIGDAGLGKSRLIRELREHVVGHAGDATVIEWRCSQYQLGTGFYPVVEYFSRLLEFEKHVPAQRLERVVRYLRELDLETAENVALLCGLLGVPTDERYPALALSPQKMKERAESLLLQWLQRLVRVRPVLFIVEDLHWLDPSTLELLEQHVAQFESGRVLSLLTFRPEFETPWKSKPHQTQIALNRLTKRQIGEMMLKRTRRRDIPEAILQQVIDRTDGIPLFIEEFTVVIVESGLLDRAEADPDATARLNVIPATLQDLLLSRLDRMESDREVVQLAATIGREFAFRLLSASCLLPEERLQSELDKLVKAEILFQKGQGADATYIFKHALLQDAAYRSMLTKRRQACHQRIAEALEARFPDVVSSQPALLAHHFTEAGLAEKAIDYWSRAGQKSQEQSANVEAIGHYERGLALTMALPASPQRDALELGLRLPLSGVLMAVQGYAAPEVEPVQNRCIELCRQLGEGAPLFPVLISNWEWLFIRGRFADCYRRCPEVIALAEAARGPGMMGEAHWTQGCTSLYAGDFPAARDHCLVGSQHFDRAASIEFAKITQQNSGPMNLAYLGMALWQLGYPDQAFARLREALELACSLKHIFTEAMTVWKVGQTYDFALIGDKAIEYGQRCRRIADAQGFAFWVALGMGCEGVGLKHLGRYDEAIGTLQEALARLEATGSFILFPKYRGHLADALWQSGQRDDALRQLDQAFADQAGGEYFMHSELLRIRGDFQFDQGELDRAETSYREAMSIALRQSAKMHELRTTLRLCRLWQQRGQTDEARRQLEPLVAWFTEGFEMPDVKAARAMLERL